MQAYLNGEKHRKQQAIVLPCGNKPGKQYVDKLGKFPLIFGRQSMPPIYVNNWYENGCSEGYFYPPFLTSWKAHLSILWKVCFFVYWNMACISLNKYKTAYITGWWARYIQKLCLPAFCRNLLRLLYAVSGKSPFAAYLPMKAPNKNIKSHGSKAK